jgi:hypothetical protein
MVLALSAFLKKQYSNGDKNAMTKKKNVALLAALTLNALLIFAGHSMLVSCDDKPPPPPPPLVVTVTATPPTVFCPPVQPGRKGTSVITVTVMDPTGKAPVGGATVTFTSTCGTIAPTPGTTNNATGSVAATFTPTCPTDGCTATITATVTGPPGSGTSGTGTVKVACKQ